MVICNLIYPRAEGSVGKTQGSGEVVSITLGTKTAWLENAETAKITWHNFSDGQENRGIAAKYGVHGIPHYALISPDGKLLSTLAGYGKGSLLAKLDELLKP